MSGCKHIPKLKKVYQFCWIERAEGEVRIKRADGEVFVLKPERKKRSAFDVEGVDLGVSADGIVEFVREGRER